MRQIFFCYLFLVLFPKVAVAQITPDNSLGAENSQVNSTSEQTEINGGAIRGENLFHSFDEFNVNEGKVVNFANPDGADSILFRNGIDIINICQQTANSEFVYIGKGGLPENPNNFLQANNIEVGLVSPTLRSEKVLLNQQANRDTMPEITPPITSRKNLKPLAQGWIQLDNGLVELVAQNPDRLGEQRNLHNDSNCQ